MKNEIEKTERELTPKELAFCEFYTALGDDTCSNGTASADKAGYKQPHNAAWKLLQRPAVRAEIRRIHAENMDQHLINPERILYELEHTKLLAQKKSDLSVVVRCIELMGKFLSMFSDRHTFITEQPKPELNPEKTEDILAISKEYYARKYLSSKRTEQEISGAKPVSPPVAGR